MQDLPHAETLELLRSEPVAHLAVVADGEPYVTPISYVFDSGALSFRTGRGRRVTAIEANPRVCVEVSIYDTDTGEWKSVVATGTARLVEETRHCEAIIAALLAKYRSAVAPLSTGARMPMGEEVIVTISLDQISGRSSGSFFTMRTRPGRL